MKHRAVEQSTTNSSEQKTRLLYWWLLLALVFEYARPGGFVPGIDALRLNSIIPLALLGATFFAKGLRSPKEILADPFTKLLIAYVGLIVFSLVYAEITLYAYERASAVVGYLFLFWLIARIVTSRAQLLGVFLTLILAHVFLLAMSPEVVTDPSARHYIQGSPFLGDGNDFALSICILIPLALDLALSTKSKWLRWLYFALTGLFVLAVVGTSSRGGSLGMFAGAAYLWWHSPNKLKALLVITTIAAAGVLYAPDSYFERMDTIRSYEEDESAKSRIDAWKGAMRIAADNPILGVGAGQFPTTYGARYRETGVGGRYMTAHSMYFLTLSELGLTGAFILLSLVFGGIVANTRASSRLRAVEDDGPANELSRTLRMMSAGMAGFAVAGAFLSVSYYPHIFVVTGLCVAARALSTRLERTARQPTSHFAGYQNVHLRSHRT